MPKLFEDNQEDEAEDDKNFNINSEYAKNYDKWRQKEELNKYKAKYGNIDPVEESSSESSSDDEELLDKNDDKDFFKTMACLKSKDPKIYQKDVKFFEEKSEKSDRTSKEKKKKEEPLYLRDYERKLLLEKNGNISDEEENTINKNKPTYVQEQQSIKESFKKALEDDDEEEDSELLIHKEKSQDEIKKEEAAYIEWLKGRETEINNEEKKELKPLRDYWNDPSLDRNEKFLRDYILNKKFLDDDTGEYEDDHYKINENDENLSEDDEIVEKQEEFEHKYNFRFEEPDQEFIKRYPRTVENSMRKKNTKRAEKRAELKQRKQEDKLRRQEELNQLQALKRKEIEEKLYKLREISGNDDIKIEDLDLEGEFDPEEHERKMNAIYNDDYYAQPEGDNKPQFPDIDEELEIDGTWDDYDPSEERKDGAAYEGPHCEDEDFNMDAEYDPTKSVQNELIENTKRKKRKRKNKFVEMLQKEKPKYDPSEYSNFLDYYDQYYSIGYEDMIGDLPCRMKYNKVVPNDYGLTVEEILLADDKELNRWCSLKKALRIKKPHEEMNEIKMFKERRKNEQLIRKILPSLFKNPEEEEEKDGEKEPQEKDKESKDASSSPSKKKNKKKNKQKQPTTETQVENLNVKPEPTIEKSQEKEKELPNEETNENEIKNRKRKISEGSQKDENPEVEKKKRKKKKKKKTNGVVTENQKGTEQNDANNSVAKVNVQIKPKKQKMKNKKDKQHKPKETNSLMKIGEETLKGYGFNPKKFKNKCKYSKKVEM